MKPLVVALLVSFMSVPGVAQQSVEQKALARRGQIKIWSGAALIGAGVIAVPVTAASTSEPRGAGATIGVGLLSAGGGLLWSGVQDQRKATRPATTFGALVGSRRALQIQRSW
jgi:hypothetical protein